MQNNSRSTPVVRVLIGVCLLVFLLQMSGSGDILLYWLALWPPLPAGLAAQPEYFSWPGFGIWQLISYAFLHGSPMHLLFNLFGLWMFGTPVERVLGAKRFVVFYGVCVIGASLAQLLAAQGSEQIAPTIGASGGVLGLLPAFAIFFPNARIQLLFPPVNLRAPVFVVVYGAIELLLGVTDSLPGIAHFAHLGGMLCGGVLLLYWIRQRRQPGTTQ